MELCTVLLIILMSFIAIQGVVQAINSLEGKSVSTITNGFKLLFMISVIVAIVFTIFMKVLNPTGSISLMFGILLYCLPLTFINLYTAPTAFWIIYTSYIVCMYTLIMLKKRFEKRSQESIARKKKNYV